MRSAIFLVTALVVSSAATPWGSRANKQCAAYCRETTNFNYDVGTIYTYDYTGETATRIGGTSQQESRLHITAQADFEAVSKCELVLRLKRVTLEQSDPEDASSRTRVSGSAEFASALEQHPLIFSFQDGQVEHLCPSVDEPVWALNVKRAIVSSMQNSMKDLAASQVVFESDVVGHCETNYTVESQGRRGVVVSRKKDLLACTGRNGQQVSPVLTTPYSSPSSIQSLPLLKSENECQQTIRNSRLEHSTCAESHLFRPFSNGLSGASTRITQTLTYRQERRSDENPTDYKRVKSSLLFDGQELGQSFAVSLDAIEHVLDKLVHESSTGASPKIPSLFSHLVTVLRPLTYRQLSDIFRKTRDATAKKFIMDAAPLVGTAGSYGLVRDMIQEGLLSNIEVDMWLASLAFQTKPTLEMISIVSPILSENPVRPKALLSISAMIHAYCKQHEDGCQNEKAIRQAIGHIESRLGVSCWSTEADRETVLLALKALGNAGFIVSSGATLKKCYQDETNPMVVRLAAIDALRRVPCHIGDRSSLLALYQDSNYDSEMRIAAYLAIMQCPTAQLIEDIKHTLTSESVNQVGSFVWTHLTNLQESSSQSKQFVRKLLSSEFLRNKFNTDARKFSRNLEASAFWPELNVGGTVESNIIFSSQSYLPRSANLNLTIDLFGESVNLMEIGARVEGFETLVESFFGPNGVYPDDTIQKTLESMRSKRASPIDKNSLNQLATIYDVKSQHVEVPQGDLYLRVFGNELHTKHFKGLEQLTGKKMSPLAMLLQAAKEKDIDFSKSMSLLNVAYTVPTVIGLPLTLSVNATANVGMKMGGTFQAEGMNNVKIAGQFRPSATVEVNGVMSVDVSKYRKSGVHVVNTMHTSTGLSGKLIIQGNQLVSVQLDAPEPSSQVFSFDSRLFLIQQSGSKAVQPSGKRIQQHSCSPAMFSKIFGVEFCGEIDFWPRTKEGPRGPLTGAAHFEISARKTDTHKSYIFEFRREELKSLSLVVDTPESKINRKFAAQLNLDPTARSLRASFVSPFKSAELAGKYEYNQLVTSADVLLNVDGAQIAAIRASLRTDIKNGSGRLEPTLVVSQNGRQIVNFGGYYFFSAGTKYGFDFQLKQLSVRPIRVTGDITKDTEKCDVNFSIKSYLLETTVASTLRVTDKVTNAKVKVEYSIMESTSHSLETSFKFGRSGKGALKRTTLAAVIQGSQYPQYNSDMSWDVQTSDNYLENNVRFNFGGDQWDIQQLFSGQPRDFNVRLAINCQQQSVDWLVYTTFQNTETSFKGQSGIKLAPGKEWTGKLDLVRQDQMPGRRYGARLELSSAKTNRMLRAEITQENMQQWDVVAEYALNKKTEISFTGVYKNLNDADKLEHAAEARFSSWATEDIQVTVYLIATQTQSKLNLNGRYGTEKAAAVMEYNALNEVEHTVTIRFNRNDDEPMFQTTASVVLGERKLVTIDIQVGRRITFDFQLTPSTAGVQFFWNRDIDNFQSFEFAAQLHSAGGHADFRWTNRRPIRLTFNHVGQAVNVQLEWEQGQAIILQIDLLPNRTTGQLETPFEALRRLSFEVDHKNGPSSVDNRLMVDWERNRFTLAVAGSKSQEKLEGSFDFTSTFNQLASLGAEVSALTTQPAHRYSVAVHHQGKRAEIYANLNRKQLVFESASIQLVTPITGYESMTATVSHDQKPGTFQTDLKLEGPFSSKAVLTVSGKREHPETFGSVSVTTTFSALKAASASFNLFNSRTDKKLVIAGAVNNKKILMNADADLSDSKVLAKMRLATPFTEDVTASVQHRSQKQVFDTQVQLSWSANRHVQLAVDGQLHTGHTMLNASLAAPGWTSSARLCHKNQNGKILSNVDTDFNGRKSAFSFDASSLAMDNIRFDTSLKTPFSGFESLRLYVEHARSLGKVNTRVQIVDKQREFSLEHQVDMADAFNWANKLGVSTPFAGLQSLVITSEQSWTVSGKFQHDGQLQFNGKTLNALLTADASRRGLLTASGSLTSSWTEDTSFDLQHEDDGDVFHPVVIIRSGSKQPVRLELTFRRANNNPSVVVEVISPITEPIKISASYLNGTAQSVKLALNWQGDRNVDWSLDWSVSPFKSSIKTRLTTPFTRFTNFASEITYDLTGGRKTATAFITREEDTTMLQAFAAAQPTGYQAEVSVTSPFFETVKAIGNIDVSASKGYIRLGRGSTKIQLDGVLAMTGTQTSATATLSTPFTALRHLKIEGLLTAEREFQLEIDADGRKVFLTGAHSSGPSKSMIKGSVQTPFDFIQQGSIDVSYDASGSTKTASLVASRNDKTVRANGQLVVVSQSGIKMALNLKAPSLGIEQFDVTGSYDQTKERKTGHMKLELNGEKYQIDGHLSRSEGAGEVSLKTQTGYQGFEQVTLDAKYDLRSELKTTSMAFSKNADKFHLAGTANKRRVSLELASPIEFLRIVKLNGQFDGKEAVLVIARNEETIKLTTSGSLSATYSSGRLNFVLETPYSGYESRRAELVFDFESRQKTLVLEADKQTIKIETEWNGRRLTIRAITPFSGFEQFNLGGEYSLDERELVASLRLEHNGEKYEYSLSGLYDPARQEASVEWQSPISIVRIVSSKLKWVNKPTEKSFNLDATRNEQSVQVEMNGRFVPDNAAFKLQGRSNLEGWNSASVAMAYDVRSSASGSLSIEKNGMIQSFVGMADIRPETARISVETPFEGFKTLGVSGTLSGQSTNTTSDKTATLHLEKDGFFQDFKLAVHFDSSSASINLETPFEDYEKLSASVRFSLDKPQKSFHFTGKKNEQKMDIVASGLLRPSTFGEGELKITSTFQGFETIAFTGKFDLSSAIKTASLKATLNDKSIEGNAALDKINVKIDFTSPFKGFERVNLNTELQFDAKMVRAAFELNGQRYEASGSLKEQRIFAQLRSPLPGYESADLIATWTDNQLQISLTSSKLGKMVVSAEQDFSQTAKYARFSVINNDKHYHNELTAMSYDARLGAEVRLSVQSPFEALNNIKSSLTYDFVPAEKTFNFNAEGAHWRYEAVGKANLGNEAGQAILHIRTPLAGYEELDFSTGYDSSRKTAFLINERNGRSIVSVQGIANLSPLSSNLAASFKAPYFVEEDVEVAAVYNLDSNWTTADGKFKLCSHELAFEGSRSSDWMLGKLSFNTSSDLIQGAHFNWDGQKQVANFKINELTVSADGQVRSITDFKIHTVLSSPSCGSHNTQVEFVAQPGKLVGSSFYQKDNSKRVGAEFSVKYTEETGDYSTVIYTSCDEIKDFKLAGHWNLSEQFKTEASVFYSGAKQYEAYFDGQFDTMRSAGRVGLLSPYMQPIKINGQYDVASTEKFAKLQFNEDVKLDAQLALHTPLQWHGKADLIAFEDKHSATVKCSAGQPSKEFTARYENNELSVSELKVTVEQQGEKTNVVATLVSPSLISGEGWNLRGKYDSSEGLNAAGTFTWAKDSSVQAALKMTPAELYAELRTPFAKFETTRFSSKLNTEGAKQTVESNLFFLGRSITLTASWESATSSGIKFSSRVNTPFEGFEDLAVSGIFTTGTDYTTVLTYSRAGKTYDVQGKLSSNDEGTNAKITFTGADEVLSAVVEYDIRNPKKVASLQLTRGEKKISINFAGEMGEKINGILVIDVSSYEPIRLSVFVDPASAEKNGRLTYEWADQQKIELVGGMSSGKSGTKLRLAVQTPFENFKKVLMNGKINPKAFDVSVEYDRNKKVQLTGTYRWAEMPSEYSVNGTLTTPWFSHPISVQSVVDLSSGFKVSGAVNWAPDRTVSASVTQRIPFNVEVTIQTPHDKLKQGRFFASLDRFDAGKSYRASAGIEYNGKEASFIHSNRAGRYATLTTSLNGKVIDLQTEFYRQHSADGNTSLKMAANVTTPFQGFAYWSGKVELSSKGLLRDLNARIETPLAAIPSVHVSVQSLMEPGRKFEVSASGSAFDQTAWTRIQLSKNALTHTASFEMDAPFLPQAYRSIKARAEGQINDLKDLAITAVATVPAGEYSARGSLKLDLESNAESNLYLNAGLKTPSFDRSIDMGAKYGIRTTNNGSPTAAHGEVFVWNNKLGFRAESTSNHLNVQNLMMELNLNAPSLALPQQKLNVEVTKRSPRQLQSTATFTSGKRVHTVSLSYQLLAGKFAATLEVESPLVQPKKTVSINVNYANENALTFEGKFVDGQNICEWTGSLRLPVNGEALYGQTKLSCSMTGTLAIELAGQTTEGKLSIAYGASTHELSYKINANEATVDIKSPLIQQLHWRGVWNIGDAARGQASMTMRYGKSVHSLLADYLKSGSSGISASLNIASPFIPAGQASLQFEYEQLELKAQLDVFGRSHRMTGKVGRWPTLSAQIMLDSPLLPKQTVGMMASYSQSGRELIHGRANVTLLYGDQSIGAAGHFRFSNSLNLDGWVELNTPFPSLTMARTQLQLSSNDDRNLNATIEFQSSHVQLPSASLNVNYHLSETALDMSAGLNTPFSRWENVGIEIGIPLTIQNGRAQALFWTPSTRYSTSGLLTIIPNQFRLETDADFAGKKFSLHVLFNTDDVYQAKIDVATPFRGFENYHWDIKGQANVRRWGEAVAFLDWNGKRIEFSSNVKAEPMAYITIVQLTTPFQGFERYAVHLRLEGTERKTLQVELESPKARVGADFDYVFNSVTDFIGKASIRTPVAGYESFTLHLSNQLGNSSYAANAEARFASYGLAAGVEGSMGEGAFNARIVGKYNNETIALKTAGSMNQKKVDFSADLATPFEMVKAIETFVKLERDLSETKGFGLNFNGKQIVLVTLTKQPSGPYVLEVRNPWRPLEFGYTWEDSNDLKHYEGRFCWNTQQRSTSSFGGSVIVRTTSYGRKLNIHTVTPRREMSLDYALELTSSKLEHAISVSWEANKTAGYSITGENKSTRRRAQLEGAIRLDLPIRSFQLGAGHTAQDGATSSGFDFSWDVARDQTKRAGARIETRNARQAKLIVFHPELERDISLQGVYEKATTGKLTGKLELIYSPLEVHHLVLEGSTTTLQNAGRSLELTVKHPASHTDLRFTADGTMNERSDVKMAARFDYNDHSMNSRFLQLGANFKPMDKLVDFEIRTADGSLLQTNALILAGTSYALSSRTSVNDVETLALNARLESSAQRPAFEIDGSYAGGKSFNWYAGMPDRRELTLRATRDIHGRQVIDGQFQIKLNRSNLLSSRVNWRSASKIEIRNVVVNGIVNVLAACESIANNLADFASTEWNNKYSLINPTAKQILHRLSGSLAREIDAMRVEFRQTAAEWSDMYERNEFYLQNIVSTVKQVASIAQPYIDQTVSSIGTISKVLIGEGTAFYRAVQTTYDSLAGSATGAYQELAGFVSSGVTEAARRSSQLAGEVIARLIEIEEAIVEVYESVKNVVNENAGHLEEFVMEHVENFRKQVIEMTRSYAESFRPYTESAEKWFESARVFYYDVVKNVQDGQRMVQEYMLTFAPFKRFYYVYLEYASWLEEFHAQDYYDQIVEYWKQFRQEAKEKFNTITARYQPLFNPIIQALEGQIEALRQIPIVSYIESSAQRMYEQAMEFTKYFELEAQLRDILRQALRHTDQLTNQFIGDLKGSFDFDLTPTVVADWEGGYLEYTQPLPFTWENFGQVPRIREFPLLRKITTAKKNLIREVDHSQFYFSAMNALAMYRPMTVRSVLPPFGSHAFVAGTQHYMTFDGRFFEFAGECSYLLASDFLRNEFSAVVNYEGSAGKVMRKSITILSDGRQIEIDSKFRVTLNGRRIEMPVVYESTTIERDGQRILVTSERSGFRIDCNLYRDICSVHVSGWSFGKTGGLFGVYNNEPSDDLMTPFRQLRTDSEIDSFANSWKVGTSRCRVRNFAVNRPNPTSRNAKLCDKLFADEQSVLRPCFQMVDPAPFARMCLNDLAALENSPKKELGVCTSAAAYASECRLAGLDVFVPSQCVRCDLEDGNSLTSGEIKNFENNAPKSADVVVIVEQKPCLSGTRVSYLPAAIDAALAERNLTNNRFAVVGFGGKTGTVFQQPHIRTADGGQIWSNRKSVQTVLESMQLEGSEVSDIHAALRFAVNLPFRVGVSKQFVLVSCEDAQCSASSYADTLTLLIENDIRLHLLQPRNLILKGRSSSDEFKNVFGFDAEEVYTVRNVRSMKGDRELRRQLALPKDFCTPLALETNGTLFDLKKMMPGSQQQQIKKFIDIFARRVAATADPSPCQRCDCIANRDGIGSIMCQRCVSPVLERLDKVWEQLVYENEIESTSNVEEVSVAQIRAEPVEKELVKPNATKRSVKTAQKL